MSRVIALVMGGWIMYCAMIGSYGGAIALLLIYVLIAFDPLNPGTKKAAGAGDTDDSDE